MAAIFVKRDQCVGCGLCTWSCPQGAITLADGKAQVGQNCVGCGLCLDTCPAGALQRQTEQARAQQGRGILVVAELCRGQVQPVTLELLAKARQLAGQLKEAPVFALLLCQDGAQQAQLLVNHGADVVYLCQGPGMDRALEHHWTQAVLEAVHRGKPEIVLFGATEFGRSLAPRVAARLQTGLTADCTVLEIDRETGLLQQTRPAFGGNLMATIQCPAQRPQMATVRPGVFQAQPAQHRQGQIENLPCPQGEGRLQLLEEIPLTQQAGIESAQILVAAGKGIGDQKNMKYIRQLAQQVGGQVAVSRPLADAGWAPYEQQVGQTGKTVAPKLYLAFGISGAIQHLAGIGGAETIVAINSDPEAPIFQAAHYAIVGDCVQVLQQMLSGSGRSGRQSAVPTAK